MKSSKKSSSRKTKSQKDPHQEAKNCVIAFLADTGLPWSSFEQTFDTLQSVLVTAEAPSDSKSRLTAMVREVHSYFVLTKNKRKGAWEKFYHKVFSQLDVERLLPEGVRWEKIGKSDWRLVKDTTHSDVLGNLLVKTAKSKGTVEWHGEKGHPLLAHGVLLSRDASRLPKSHQRLSVVKVVPISTTAYTVTLELHLPLRKIEHGREHLEFNYVDSKKAELEIRKLVPRAVALRIEATRSKSVQTAALQYVERLSMILRS